MKKIALSSIPYVMSAIIAALLILAAQMALAANTITKHPSNEHIYVIDWTSDASGNASLVSPVVFRGLLLGVKFIPGASVTSYNASLVDAQGVNLFANFGTGLPTLATDAGNYHTPMNSDDFPYYLFDSALTLTISGAGDTKSGQILLFVK